MSSDFRGESGERCELPLFVQKMHGAQGVRKMAAPARAEKRRRLRHQSTVGRHLTWLKCKSASGEFTQQAAIFRPNSFPSRPRGPSWTSRRSTRSGQSRPQRRFPPSMRAFASPLCRGELADRGSHIFSPPQREVVHGCAKFFEATAEEGKRNGMNVQTGWRDEPNSAKHALWPETEPRQAR